jgi:hypothetical protein
VTSSSDRPEEGAERPSVQEGGITIGGNATFHGPVAARDQYNYGQGLDDDTRLQIKELLERIAQMADEDRSIPRETRAALVTQAEEAKKEVDEPEAPQSLIKRVEQIAVTIKNLGDGAMVATPLYGLVKGIGSLLGIPLP